MVILGKIRNRKEKKILAAKEDIQAEYEIKRGDRPTKRYVKRYSTKEWNRFSDSKKQILSNRYHVILTDHETRKEKLQRRAKGVNLKNFDKNMKKFDKAQKSFWKSWDEGMSKAGLSKKDPVKSIYPKKQRKVKIF